jgi:hypothetical membrane protein
MRTQAQVITPDERSSDIRRSGLFYILAGVSFIMLVTFLEIIYPGYSVHSNAISDLLAVGRQTSTIGEPVAFLIAVSWILGGYFLYRKSGKNFQLVLNMLPGTGLLLAVLSPENVNVTVHSIGAILAFAAGPVVMILAYRTITTVFRYFSIVLGIFSLAAVVLEFGAYYSILVQQTLGPGGTERLIVYPIIVWLIGYGNYLIGKVDRQ